MAPTGNSTATDGYRGSTCATGDDVLTQLSFDEVERWFVVMANLIIGFTFHTMAYLILRTREVKFLQFSADKSA
jgi:hypothetical protein